ncbi:MAG: hypothetical protein WCQ99_02775 [Pseudomonadota bacterium]
MDEAEFPKELIEDVPEEKEKPEKLFESVYTRIMNMGVHEKIKLATLGNKEARNILIKDANRLVVQAVMNSPKLTGDEVISYAGNRNLAKEVPMIIASRKEFMKSYAVQLALVNNSKTPVPTAINLVSHLRENDLRSLLKNKNISSMVSMAARRTLSSRGKG